MKEFTVIVIDNCKDKRIEAIDRWDGLQAAVDNFNLESCNVNVNLETIRFDEITVGTSLQKICESKGTILSGSSYSLNNYNKDPSIKAMFDSEISFIKKTRKPLLGICFGHQIIGVAYDFDVDYCKEEEEGIFNLDIKKPFDLLPEKVSSIKVEMKHKKQIIYAPRFDKHFDVISSNDNCKIQIFQHKEKKIYGVQFHVETKDENALEDGKTILKNFFSICSI